MNSKKLIGSAELWNHNTTAEHARRWVEKYGTPFLRLKGSQIAGIERSVQRSRSAAGFLRDLKVFLRKAARRGKGSSMWDQKIENKTLLFHFRAAFHNALNSTERNRDCENSAFQFCCDWLARNDPKAPVNLRQQRDLAIVKEYLAALVKCYRAKEQVSGQQRPKDQEAR